MHVTLYVQSDKKGERDLPHKAVRNLLELKMVTLQIIMQTVDWTQKL